MKIRSLLTLVGLAIGFALPTFATENKEINFSGTHYWSATPKVFQIDPDRIILEMEIYGIRVNDSNDGPFNGASVYIAVLQYENKGPVDPVRSRNYCVWTDKDGDKVIWELTDDPSGGPSGTARLIDGTGKYTSRYPKKGPSKNLKRGNQLVMGMLSLIALLP